MSNHNLQGGPYGHEYQDSYPEEVSSERLENIYQTKGLSSDNFPVSKIKFHF